eukprot:GGOE01049430.1.p1 GENE.GGOE01049430.1~~GGOE01049430.1.p1  ORF type:complete len:359 (-),score=73.22 GGOE01049430.1:17-1000(-)
MHQRTGNLRTITDDLTFQQELNECINPQLLLGVELYSHTFGPCRALHPLLQKLAAGNWPVTVAFLAADVDLILQSCGKKTVLFGSPLDDDVQQSKWLQLLQKWQGCLEPTFAFYRSGHLLQVVEGPNLPAIARTVSLLTADPPIPPPHAPSQRQRSAAAFSIQCVWRRWAQLQRRGEVIDGVVYRGKELLWKREQLERMARLQVLKAKQVGAAGAIQRVWRGWIARRGVEQLRKVMLRRGRQTMAGRLLRPTSSTSSGRSPRSFASHTKSLLQNDPRSGMAVSPPRPSRMRSGSLSPPSVRASRDTLQGGLPPTVSFSFLSDEPTGE